MESNYEVVKRVERVEIDDDHFIIKKRNKQKIVASVVVASCLVAVQGDSANNFNTNTNEITINAQMNKSCSLNKPSKFFFQDNLKSFDDLFQFRIKEELKDYSNYYTNSYELAKNEIIRVHDLLKSIESESIDMEVSPNGSVIFEIKLKNSETLLIVNKPIDKLNDDTVVLTVMQNKEHLFTNLKSLEEVISGSEILTSA